MKKILLAIGLLILISLKISYANVLSEIKNPNTKIAIQYQDQIHHINFEPAELKKQDRGFINNLFHSQYLLAEQGTQLLFKELKIQEKAANAQFNYQTQKISPAQKGHQIQTQVLDPNIINQIKLKPVQPKLNQAHITNNYEQAKQYIGRTINIEFNQHKIPLDVKLDWFELNSDKLQLRSTKVEQTIKNQIQRYESDPQTILLTDHGQHFELSQQIRLGIKANPKQIHTIANNILKRETHKLTSQISYPYIYQGQEKLNIIGYGKSNYEGSIPNRIKNIQMGAQVYDQIVIPAKSKFSYNHILANKGRYVNWVNAYIIVNGKDLELSPGGGLCQTSTTIFRSALKAGLDIVKWKNHSLYVKYYSAFGDGLDSTIYPNRQDLQFQNPYEHPIYLHSYTDEQDNMHSFLISKGKKIPTQMRGPFYGKNNEKLSSGKTLKSKQIGWERIRNNQVEEFISSYNTKVRTPKDPAQASQL